MKTIDVLTLGSAMIDHTFYTKEVVLIPRPMDALRRRLMGFEYGAKIFSENFYSTLGGGACNTAVALTRLGLKVALRASLGNDGGGGQMLSGLKKMAVSTRWVERWENEHTGMSFLVVEPSAHEHVVFATQGANARLDCSLTLLTQLKPRVVFVAPLRARRWKNMMSVVCGAAKRRHTVLAWNPGTDQLAAGVAGLKPFLAHTNVLIVNEDEATELVLSGFSHAQRLQQRSRTPSLPDLAKRIAELGPTMVVITAGVKGAGVLHEGRWIFQKAMKVKTQDTTGAGDCFGATFVGLRQKGLDVELALRGAAINAASLVECVGAQQGLLHWPELEQKLKRQHR